MFTKRICFAALICVAAFAGGAALAQRTDTAFMSTGLRCSDITWQPSVVARYPHVADACQGVVRYNGTYFVKFMGTVQSVSGNGQRVSLKFNGVDDMTTLTPAESSRLFIAGQSYAFHDLSRGQELTFHVPATEFVAYFFEPRSETEFVAVQFDQPLATPSVRLTAAAPAARTLPPTSSWLSTIGLTGVLMFAVGVALVVPAIASRR
ncbi:MAG TPA: hypothetical protein VE907_05000 [Gammaproteobacteria bacterium]|nr:hypothetical protein [Gammaproteobacteria bacterium]